MPITLPPISRRQFVAGSLAAAAAGLLPQSRLNAAAAADLDPHRVALLSDTHVAADAALVARNVNMSDHLRQACAQVLELNQRPAHVLINGDFAFKNGQPGDYAQAVKLLEPLRTAAMPVHVGLGNHDHRANFYAGVPDQKAAEPPVKDKRVALVETPRANWLLLDSLDITDEVPGLIGPDQLAWLGKTLDAHPDKPALVVVHHHPTLDPKAKIPGIVDTAALLDILSPRKQAKVLVFGHTHKWTHAEQPDGLHLVNLPAVAYVFEPGQPSGWVDARIADAGATFELRCLDSKHPQAGQKLDLRWRS